MKTSVLLTTLAIGFALTFAAHAQEFPPAGAAETAPPGTAESETAWDKRDVRELVQLVMVARLAEGLQLTDEQTVVMMRRLEKIREHSDALAKERRELHKNLQQSLREKAPDQEIKEGLHALLEHDEQAARERREMFAQACEGLSVEQQAKLYVFIGEFHKEMQRLIKQARQRTHGRQQMGPAWRGEGPPAGGGPGQGPWAQRRGMRGQGTQDPAPWRRNDRPRRPRIGGLEPELGWQEYPPRDE